MNTWEHDVTEDVIKGIPINSAGFGVIPKIVMQDKRLHISAKAIYAYFTSFAGGGDSCFPSRNKVCFDLGISNDTFGKYLRQLVDCGYINITQEKVNGRFSHNVYTLCGAILPCPKISDTEDFVHGNLDTNNNSIKNNSIIKNNIDIYAQTENLPEKKPVKHKYGEYSNVLLSDEELEKLRAEISNVNDYIERLSSYIASTGKVYKSHYATIRNWYRKDMGNKPKNAIPEPSDYIVDYERLRKEYL